MTWHGDKTLGVRLEDLLELEMRPDSLTALVFGVAHPFWGTLGGI